MVCEYKTNVSSSAGSVYLFATAFLQPHFGDNRGYPLSAIQRPKISLDRGVGPLLFPPRQDRQDPGLVPGLVVGTDRKRRRTFSWTLFRPHQRLLLPSEIIVHLLTLSFQLYHPFKTIQGYMLDSVRCQNLIQVCLHCSLYCLY